MQITTTAASRPRTGEAKPLIGGLLYKNNSIYPNFADVGRKGSIVSRAVFRFAHTFNRFARFIGDYRYYRGKGFNSKSARYLAGMTLP